MLWDARNGIIRNMKIAFLVILVFSMIQQTALASKRIEDVLTTDLTESFQQIALRKSELSETKESIEALQLKLKEARKGKATYIKIRNVAGTLAIVSIATGAYKLTFPSGLKFTGLKLMLSSYLAVSGVNEGMIKLNQSDIENLSRQIILSLIRISKIEKAINAEIKIFCHQDPRDRLCYELKD